MTPRAALSRRTAVLVSAVVPGLAACDIDPPQEDRPAGAPTPDADSVLVGSVVAAIVATETIVGAARDAAPGLAPALDRLVSDHAAHRELLAGAAPDVPTPSAAAGGAVTGRVAALAAVRRAERGLRSDLERAVLAASSGDLARVLAVVAASLAQHVTALDAAADQRTVG